MKIIVKLIILCFVSTLSLSCTVEKSPINFGKDACISCKMNIVDKRHAAEIVTKKGKVFKYDAIECMVRDIKERKENSIALFLITDYSSPGELVDATKSTYLISENLPSPMGVNLTGFMKKEDAIKMHDQKSGQLYNWSELKELF